MQANKKSAFPWLITAAIFFFVLFLAWAANQAATGGTDITDRDYYSKGLKYNSTLIEKKAASVIGWRLVTRLESEKLKMSLTDRDDQPVSGANGHIIFPEPGSNRSQSFALQEGEPGTYYLEIPADLAGEVLARVDFELDGARINRQLLLNIPQGNQNRE